MLDWLAGLGRLAAPVGPYRAEGELTDVDKVATTEHAFHALRELASRIAAPPDVSDACEQGRGEPPRD